MAIYKLSEFCNYLKGQIEKKENSFIQKYPIISAGVNIKGYYSKYNRDGKYICISTSGASTGHVTYYEGKFWASDCLTLELNNLSMLKSNFFKFLLFKSEKLFKQLKTGSAQQHIYWKDIKNISFDIPSLKEQQKIIDIIEPQKHLFEKYHNCIRIDSFENTKKDLQKIIDIIEPIEHSIQILKKIVLNLKIMRKNIYNFCKKEEAQLKNIGRTISGKQPPLKEHINSPKKGYVRFLQNRDYGSSQLKSFIKQSFKGVYVNKYDLLIDKYGVPGKMRYGKEGCINVAMMKFIPHNFDYFSESIRNHFENEQFLKFIFKASQASTRSSLNWGFLQKIKIKIVNKSINQKLFNLLKTEILILKQIKKFDNYKKILMKLLIK